jgi:hypothetical protein
MRPEATREEEEKEATSEEEGEVARSGKEEKEATKGEEEAAAGRRGEEATGGKEEEEATGGEEEEEATRGLGCLSPSRERWRDGEGIAAAACNTAEVEALSAVDPLSRPWSLLLPLKVQGLQGLRTQETVTCQRLQ